MDWYTPYVAGNLAEGVTLLPPQRGKRIYVANSHKLAVACWRYWERPKQRLTYYRVKPLNFGGEPTPVDEIPGLFACHSATVIGRVPDGSGSPPETIKYSDENDLCRSAAVAGIKSDSR